jgi:competence protein ComEC
MLGIIVHGAMPTWPVAWLIIIPIVVVSAALLRHRPRVSSSLLAIAVLVIGIWAAQLSAFYYPRNHIGSFATEQPRLAQLELALDQSPRTLYDPFEHGRPLPPKQVVTARVLRVKTWNGWTNACGDVLVQIGQPHPRLAAGQTIRVLGTLQRPGPAMNPGQFDWAQYYRSQRMLTTLSVPHLDNVQILTEAGPGTLWWAREKTRHLLAAGFTVEQSLDHALLRAMLLGDHDPQLRDVQDQFQRTGISYQLSVSGMHVAVLAGVVYFLCRLLCIGPRKTVCIATLFVLAYGLMALPSVPVVRSMLLCVAVGGAVLSGRPADRVQLLALCVMAMLIVHPPDLYSAGFQLGFGVVLGLILLTGPLTEFLKSFRDPDMVVARQWADVLAKPSAKRAVRRWVKRKLAYLAVGGAVAWLVSMPLVAYHFEEVNPYTVLADVVLAPIVLLSLLAGAAKVLLTALWPSAAQTWAWVACQPVDLMRWVLGGLAKLPGANIALAAPPIWMIVLFYVLLALPLLLRHWPAGRRARWCVRGAPASACCMLLMLPLLGGFARHDPAAGAGELRITILSVGAGQCAAVEPSGAGVSFFDDGSDTVSDVFRKCMEPFLRHEGRQTIASIFLSHGDYDHISGTEDAVTACDVPIVYASPHLRRHMYESIPCQEMVDDLDAMGKSPTVIFRGSHVQLAEGTDVEILWPPEVSKLDSNECGLVLRLTWAGRSILFPADIQEKAEKELLKDPARLKSDVLIAPHHGSSEITTSAFVRAVDPSIILSSNADKLTVKQMNFEKMIGDRPLYRTNRCGAITLTVTKDGQIRVTTFLKPKP